MGAAPQVRVRPGELSHARRDEIDMNAAVWTISAEKMKMRKPHHVPCGRPTGYKAVFESFDRAGSDASVCPAY